MSVIWEFGISVEWLASRELLPCEENYLKQSEVLKESRISVLFLFFAYLFITLPYLDIHTYTHELTASPGPREYRAAQGQQVIDYRAFHSATISPSPSLPLFFFGRSTHPPWPC